MSGRRVVLVATQLARRAPGGIGTYCLGLVAGLQACRAGGQKTPPVELLTAGRGGTGGWGGTPGPTVGDADRWLSHGRLPWPPALVTRAWDRGRCPVGDDRSLVHATSLAVPAHRGGPLVVTVHDLLWRVVPAAFPATGRRWHEAALARALRRADHLVAPSSATADALVQAGAEAARVTVIEHGSDHLPPADHGAADTLLTSLGVARPFVLSVGTREPRKNLDRLVLSWRRACALLGDPLDLVVVGPRGWGVDGLEAPPEPPGGTAPGSSGAGVLVATGPVAPAVLAALYERAALVAYVPLAEGYGLPPVEAMRAGTPVVSSPMPSVGDAAVVVDPTDVQAIARAMVGVVTDAEQRRQLIERGRQRASRCWRDAAADHLALWERVG